MKVKSGKGMGMQASRVDVEATVKDTLNQLQNHPPPTTIRTAMIEVKEYEEDVKTLALQQSLLGLIDSAMYAAYWMGRRHDDQ